MSNNYTRWTPEMEQKLRQLKAEGLTASEIAERLGTTVPSVNVRTIRLGLQNAKRGKSKKKKIVPVQWTEAKLEKMRLMLYCNYEEKDIARAIRVTDGQLKKKLKELGWKRKEWRISGPFPFALD